MKSPKHIYYKSKGQFKGIDATVLKLIAVITMLIDHIGASFIEEGLQRSAAFNQETYYYINNIDLLFRAIGRVSFPIFCFLIVEGFFKTKNLKKYLIRMIAFSVISEIPFDMAFSNTFFDFDYQNVFCTLSIGLIAMTLIQRQENIIMKIATGAVCAAGAQLLGTDYGAYGVVLILGFYFLYRMKFSKEMLSCVMIALESSFPRMLIPIGICASSLYLYNGERGKGMKYFFYVFYPAHLFVLGLILHICFRN